MGTNIFDPDYVQKQQVLSLQRMAAEQNALRIQLYTQASGDWVLANTLNRDKGLPIAKLPAMPKKIVVGDDGQWTETAFLELVPPVLPPEVPPATTGSIRATGNVPPDRLDQVLSILRLFNDKLDAITRQVGVK